MSRHLKAFAAPKSWTLLRKVSKWITRPKPGAHNIERALPVGLLLKQLGCAQTTRETKKIINGKSVFVDGKVIKDRHFGVGFMDSIQIKPEIALRCSLDEKGKLLFVKVPESELNIKVCKIIGKRAVRGGKIQLNLSDGRNILSEKKEYAVGDSLLLNVPSQKVVEHLPFAKGSVAFLIGGKHTSNIGTVEEIRGERVWCTKGKEKIETLKELTFVVGKEKPAVKL